MLATKSITLDSLWCICHGCDANNKTQLKYETEMDMGLTKEFAILTSILSVFVIATYL